MAELTASRTLVKSSPELWAECSDAGSLARHLGAFGEIRITRLEPETAVAWEGEDVRGTVTLEPSGWGTRVVLTAETSIGDGAIGDGAREPVPDDPTEQLPDGAREPVPDDPTEQLPDDVPGPEAIEPGPVARRGRFGRRFAFWRRSGSPEPDRSDPAELAPVTARARPQAAAAPPAQPHRQGEDDARRDTWDGDPPPSPVLVDALNSLGQAHRRPFSQR